MKNYKFKWIQTTMKDGQPITKCCVCFYEGEVQNVEKNALDNTLESRYVRTKLLKIKEFEFKRHLSQEVLATLMDKELFNVDR